MSSKTEELNLNPFKVLFDKLQHLTDEVTQLKNQTAVANEPRPLLTRPEAAELLRVSVNTIDRWTRDNKIIPKGLGGRIYYDREDLLNAVKSLK